MRFDGNRLRSFRTARKWDQHRLAEAARAHGVGITQSQVSRYENGQEPAARNAMALAAALEVNVSDFFANGSDGRTEVNEDDEESDPVALVATLLQRAVDVAVRVAMQNQTRERSQA